MASLAEHCPERVFFFLMTIHTESQSFYVTHFSFHPMGELRSIQTTSTTKSYNRKDDTFEVRKLNSSDTYMLAMIIIW